MFVKWLGSTRFFFAPDDGAGSGADTGDAESNGANGDGANEADTDGDLDADGAGDQNDDGDGGEAGDQNNGDPPSAAAATTDKEIRWRDRQLARQHRRLQDLQRDNDTLRAIAEGRQPPANSPAPTGTHDGTPPQSQPGAKKTYTEEEARQMASQMASQNQYDADCNAVFAKGKDAFKDWEDALARLPKLGGIDRATMEAILATDVPEQALYAIASDPDEYERVMDLPAAKRQNALFKLGLKKAAATKTPSNAPEPPNRQSGGRTPVGRVDLYDDNVSDDDWYKAREQQRAQRHEQKFGRRA